MIVRRLEEVAERPVDGVDGVTIRWMVERSVGGDDYGHEFALRYFTMESGASYPLHSHYYVEAVFLVSGKLAFSTNGQDWQEVNPGDVVYVPRWEPHALKNIGEGKAVFTCCIDHEEMAGQIRRDSC